MTSTPQTMTLSDTAAEIGDTDPDRPVPYALTPKALAALAGDAGAEAQERWEREAVTAWEAVNAAGRQAGGAR